MDQSPKTVLDVVREARVADEQAQAAALEAAQAQAAAAATAAAPAEEGAAKAKAVFTLYKADAERGVIYTFASAAAIVDKDEDVIPQADLIALAHGFVAEKGGFNANHGQKHFDVSKAQLVESIVGAPILKSGKTLALGEPLPPVEADPVIGMNIEKGRETHWLIGVALNDPAAIEAAKKGGIVGASIEAWCDRTEVSNA